MTISELIYELERIEEEYGNLPVRVVSDDYCLSIHKVGDVRPNQVRCEWVAEINIK